MPKLKSDFPCNMNINVPCDLRKLLKAIGYHRGDGGQYGGVARYFLEMGAREYVSKLSDIEKERFNQILSNVGLSEDMLREMTN